MSSNDDLFRSAIEHYRSGRAHQARSICREIVAGDECHGQAQAMLGLIAHREDDFDEAARRFDLAARAQPEQPLHRVNLGAALLAAGRRDDALATLRDATAIFPDHAGLWSSLGEACLANERWSEAESAFACASRAEPENTGHGYRRALACDRAGRLVEAAALYRAVLARDPRHGDAGNGLGLLLMAEGNLHDASASFTAAFIAGSHAGAGLNLSRCLVLAGEADRAVEIARHVVSAHPEMAVAHRCLGEALEATGARTEAVACYRQALACDPGDADARALLAAALDA